jgi:hypothetical protein
VAAAAIAAVAFALTRGDGEDEAGERAGVRAARSVVTPPRVYPYPAPVVRRFVRACVREAPGEGRTCRCVIADLQTRLPYPEFQAADQAIRRGRPLPARARREFDASTRLCRALD